MLTNAASMGTDSQFSILPHPSLNKIYAISILNLDLDILSGHLPTFPQVCKPINYNQVEYGPLVLGEVVDLATTLGPSRGDHENGTFPLPPACFCLVLLQNQLCLLFLFGESPSYGIKAQAWR